MQLKHGILYLLWGSAVAVQARAPSSVLEEFSICWQYIRSLVSLLMYSSSRSQQAPETPQYPSGTPVTFGDQHVRCGARQTDTGGATELWAGRSVAPEESSGVCRHPGGHAIRQDDLGDLVKVRPHGVAECLPLLGVWLTIVYIALSGANHDWVSAAPHMR